MGIRNDMCCQDTFDSQSASDGGLPAALAIFFYVPVTVGLLVCASISTHRYFKLHKIGKKIN